jgi:hypothetical protein
VRRRRRLENLVPTQRNKSVAKIVARDGIAVIMAQQSQAA